MVSTGCIVFLCVIIVILAEGSALKCLKKSIDCVTSKEFNRLFYIVIAVAVILLDVVSNLFIEHHTLYWSVAVGLIFMLCLVGGVAYQKLRRNELIDEQALYEDGLRSRRAEKEVCSEE